MNTLRDAIRNKDFVVTADLALAPSTAGDDITARASALRPHIDALQVLDDRDAAGHMSSLAAAAIASRAGIDVTLHLTARDRNRVALKAEILGAAALGVTSLVLTRGEKLSRKGYLRGKGVFDTSESRFIGIAKRIGDESGHVSAPGFLIGTYVTAFAPAADWEAARINESLDAGVTMLQTQPCLNARVLRAYMERLVKLQIPRRASVIVEVPVLSSAEDAEKHKSRKRETLIPKSAVQRLADAVDPRSEGLTVCAEMLRELRGIPGVAGACLRFAQSASDVAEIVKRAS